MKLSLTAPLLIVLSPCQLEPTKDKAVKTWLSGKPKEFLEVELPGLEAQMNCAFMPFLVDGKQQLKYYISLPIWSDKCSKLRHMQTVHERHEVIFFFSNEVWMLVCIPLTNGSAYIFYIPILLKKQACRNCCVGDKAGDPHSENFKDTVNSH